MVVMVAACSERYPRRADSIAIAGRGIEEEERASSYQTSRRKGGGGSVRGRQSVLRSRLKLEGYGLEGQVILGVQVCLPMD